MLGEACFQQWREGTTHDLTLDSGAWVSTWENMNSGARTLTGQVVCPGGARSMRPP